MAGNAPPVNRRVVVTGVGPVTPLGLGADAFWTALRAGQSGIARIEGFESSVLTTQIAGEIRGFDPKLYVAKRKNLKMMTPAIQFGMAAAKIAIDDSGLDWEAWDPDRVGIAVGTGSSGGEIDMVIPALEASVDETGEFDIVRFGQEGMDQINPLWLIRGLSNAVLGHVSAAHRVKGYNTNICNSGASGLQAIGEAARAIATGRADVMIAGGYDALVNAPTIARFERLGMLTHTQDPPEGASRPFDARRDGFVLSDGAAFLMLETLEAAQARGARMYAEVGGYALAQDGASFLDPQPDGGGLTRALAGALEDAEVDAGDLDVIFAHAPGTRRYDAAETAAIKTVLGAHAPDVAVPAIKSMLGHCVAASGAVAAAAAACAVRHQGVPPTINRQNVDPHCDLDCVPDSGRDLPLDSALIDASGLGGMHAAVVLRRIRA